MSSDLGVPRIRPVAMVRALTRSSFVFASLDLYASELRLREKLLQQRGVVSRMES
jgi:hypothetical protein